jgi:pyruvate/2-oxoglutarate dehydrogenase complex dihydrolipoamide dehydrogenase (E3) component
MTGARRRDMAEQVEVVVVGLGVGGEIVGGKLAKAGLSVVGVEAGLVGGECPFWGCVPSKMMIRAANLLQEARRVEGMAGTASVTPDWAPVARRIRDEATSDWDDSAAVERFQETGARFVRGHGTLTGPGRVEVDGTVFEASRAVVLATGARPVVPPIEGLSDTPYWTSRQAVEAEELPASLAVLGGSAVGLELAQAYARFGVAVTVVEIADRLLPAEEPEASAVVHEALTADGITVHTSAEAQWVAHRDGEFQLDLGDRRVTSGELMVSTGRRADLVELGVDAVGLDPKAEVAEVDERMRAGERLWAVGDVTGHGQFTHVATYQAMIAVRDILGQPGPPADYRAVPRVTYTDPEVGVVGMTEAQAREAGLNVVTGKAELPTVARGWIHKAGNEGFLKVIGDADRGVLVGATSAGPAGGEVLSMLALAVQEQVPVRRLRHMILAYPTFHRGIADAVRGLARQAGIS